MIDPMKIRNKEKRRIELARQSNIPIYSQQFVDKLDSELSALRSQVAELQRQLDEYDRRIVGVGEIAINSVSRDAYDGAREDAAIWKKRALEAERKLDEQATQEPVGVGARWPEEADKRILYLLWTEGEIEETESVGMEAVKLYALPPNLPAMIEQARAEEREACAKVCDEIVEFFGDEKNLHELHEREKATAMIIADAIRARRERA